MSCVTGKAVDTYFVSLFSGPYVLHLYSIVVYKIYNSVRCLHYNVNLSYSLIWDEVGKNMKPINAVKYLMCCEDGIQDSEFQKA